MKIDELLAVDAELKEDLSSLERRLRRGSPEWRIAGKCLAVSATLSEQIEFALHVAHAGYMDDQIEIHVGNIAGADGQMLWDDDDIKRLARDVAYLSQVKDGGYHAWLQFAGSIIDLTVLCSMSSDDPLATPSPYYIDRDGVSYPDHHITYRSLRVFNPQVFDNIPLLPIH